MSQGANMRFWRNALTELGVELELDRGVAVQLDAVEPGLGRQLEG